MRGNLHYGQRRETWMQRNIASRHCWSFFGRSNRDCALSPVVILVLTYVFERQVKVVLGRGSRIINCVKPFFSVQSARVLAVPWARICKYHPWVRENSFVSEWFQQCVSEVRDKHFEIVSRCQNSLVSDKNSQYLYCECSFARYRPELRLRNQSTTKWWAANHFEVIVPA